MSESGQTTGPAGSGDRGLEVRRRRVADVFGDVLPDTTRDEQGPPDDDSGDCRGESLQRDVPPHHG